MSAARAIALARHYRESEGLSIAQIADRLVRDAITRGELKAVKRGRGYLITAAAVEAWATPTQVPTSRSTRPSVHRDRRRPRGPMRRALSGS